MNHISAQNEVPRRPGVHKSGTVDVTVAANEPGSEILAAVARSLTRAFALYFSRPVRLFRPAKVTGWQFLRKIASQEGASLTPSYVLSMCRTQGVWVVPKHFLPPIIVNAGLGTVLWTTYGFANDVLSAELGSHSIAAAALAGGFAGGCQALVAAPAENVRLLLEGGSGGHSWSCVWKEVFRSRAAPPSLTLKQEIQEIRELRTWLKDVGDMAGRGWDGWKWGCGKDICAFAAFFTVFEFTRRASSTVVRNSQDWLQYTGFNSDQYNTKNIGKVINACTLVTGGVLAGLVYEGVSRPWDRVRRLVHLHESEVPAAKRLHISGIIREAIHKEGIVTLYRDPLACHHQAPSSWLVRCGRTLARVGPWGIGFLVWESYSSGLS